MYARMLQSIEPEDRDNSKKLLTCVALAFKPLYLEAIADILDCQASAFTSEEQATLDAIEVCAPMLKLRGKTVEFVHLSARDYLLRVETDRDLVLEHLAKGHTQDHLVQEATSGGGLLSGLVTVAPDLDVLEAAQELGRHKVGRLPVVEGDRLVGIVSAGDLAKQLRKALDGLLAEGEKAEQ